MAALSLALIILSIFLGHQKDDIWWNLRDAAWYLGVAALIAHAILLPAHTHPMLFGVKIGAIGFGFIAYSGLFSKEIEDVMWSFGGAIMVIGFIVAYFGFMKGKGSK